MVQKTLNIIFSICISKIKHDCYKIKNKTKLLQTKKKIINKLAKLFFRV